MLNIDMKNDAKYEKVWDEKYIKTKIKIFNQAVNKIFSDIKIPNERSRYTRIATITSGSAIKIGKKNSILKFI